MTTTPEAILAVEGLAFRYPARPVFDGWSHRFGAGLHWVRGPNGCGKSTLLKLLGGALDPILGRRTVDGVEATERPTDYRRAVYWCGPEGPAFDHLSPAELAGLLAGLYPGFDLDRLAPLAEALGLAPFIAKRIATLSTGTQRKVAVAMALCAGTRVLLLDEPLAALDRATLAVVRHELALLARSTTQACLVTSHESLGDDADALARVIDLPLP